MIIDSHVHINDDAFIGNPDKYIKDAEASNVCVFLCIGSNLKTSQQAVEIADKYPNVWAAVGVHPSDVKSMGPNDFALIDEMFKNPKVIAVGEVGLDYFWDKDKKAQEEQVEWFHKFIDLANKHNVPIIIHSRDAINATYEILRDHPVKKAGIIHCYSAGKDYVKRYVELGYYFGIGGTVTFKNALSVKEAVEAIPIDRLLLETDAPYLAPTPHRGEQNHSKYIPLIINEIARLKGIDNKVIEDKTTENFEKLFSVKHS
ncbi:MAG: TatD family hydrolase [Bacilli bacterium]|nr:TatD family hydrolase [Bacilli bacterium]